MNESISGSLSLGNLFQLAELAPEDVLIIRHSLKPDGLRTRADAMGPNLLPFVREQGIRNSKLPRRPPGLWLNFLATTGRRARFLAAYENHGEVITERTDTLRYFDLMPSPVFAALVDRLVIEWTNDPVNWAKTGDSATGMAVVEISDPVDVAFPGFDGILIGYDELQSVISDERYKQWQTALRSVQGIYVIADTLTGKLYVGKADGIGGFLGRWSEYAKNGHGGNIALRELAAADALHRQHFQFSILQVFSPSAPGAQVDAAEAHFKRVLLTRQFGMNLN